MNFRPLANKLVCSFGKFFVQEVVEVWCFLFASVNAIDQFHYFSAFFALFAWYVRWFCIPLSLFYMTCLLVSNVDDNGTSLALSSLVPFVTSCTLLTFTVSQGAKHLAAVFLLF